MENENKPNNQQSGQAPAETPAAGPAKAVAQPATPAQPAEKPAAESAQAAQTPAKTAAPPVQQPQAKPAAPAQPAAQPATQSQPPTKPTAPAQPTAQPAPTAAPAAKPAQPQASQMTQATPAAKPAQPAAPGAPGQVAGTQQLLKQTGTRKPPNPKRLIYGCSGCSGLAILFFIIFVLVFVAQTTATGENPLARALGTNTASLINTLIVLVHLIFGVFFVLLFVLTVIGVFRFFMARKDDKVSRKKGLVMAGVAGLLLFINIFIWIAMYSFLTANRVPEAEGPVAGIVTEPENTLQLTAPVNIEFDASYAPIPTNKYDILSYLWDFGDGSTATAKTITHLYTDMGANNGRFDVQLQINIRDKQTGQEGTETYNTTVTIANVELMADFTAEPESGPAPLTVDFDASGSIAPAGEITSYEWDFDGSNTFRGGTGATITNEFEQVGTYSVGLRVTDSTGNFKVVNKDITVEGANIPTAVINIPTTDGNYYAGQQYTFEGEKSSSPNGSVEKYEWDFGDGSAKANTRTASHTYKETGEYEVILKVTDEENKTGETALKIKVETQESAPIAVIKTVPESEDDTLTGTVPFEIAFDGSDSTDPDSNIVEYQWDFDGDGEVDSSGENVTYAYKEEGIFNATLIVTDAEENESRAVMVVNVGGQPLQARIVADPVDGVQPLTVDFDATSSSYPGGQIVSYEWDFGDDTAKRIDVAQVTHKYTKIGTFTASVTAIASDNTKSTAEIPVNVRPVPLTSCFEAIPETGTAPLEVEFDPFCSSGTVAKWSWDFGDGESSKSRKPSHTYDNPGSYTVTLEVADNQNVLDTFTKNILVTGTL